MNTPQVTNKPKLDNLNESVQDYINYLDSGEYNVDYAEHYKRDILEKAVKAITNENVYDWINKKIDEADEQ